MGERISVRGMRFAGTFYPSDRLKLIDFIRGSIDEAVVVGGRGIGNSLAYIVPHAGYAYSGKVASHSYKAIASGKALNNTDTVVVIGPNHTGIGPDISVSGCSWRTPLGDIVNDYQLSSSIAKSMGVKLDESAHEDEHSIEVQLPFIKYIAPELKGCFICMADQSLDASNRLCLSIVSSAKRLGRNLILIASSDLNHFESDKVSERKDMELLGNVCKMRVDGFERGVSALNDSVCGPGAIMTAIGFAKANGAKRGAILKYSNSGEANGDYRSVVAYASVSLY